MKILRFSATLGCLLFSTSLVCYGQIDERKSDIPTVPANAHWCTVFKPANNSKSPSLGNSDIVRIETIQTRSSRRVIQTLGDGSIRDYDEVGPYVLTERDGKTWLSTVNLQSPPFPFYTRGFLFIDSATSCRFTGLVEYGGQSCAHYKTGTGEFWLDSRSNLPLAARSGQTWVEFQFLPAPNEPIRLSPNKEALLQKQEKARAAFRALK